MRKALYLYLLLTFIFAVGCEDFSLFSGRNNNLDPGAFSLVINDTLIYDATTIDFYDMSTHLIYLKEGHSYTYNQYGSFSVLSGYVSTHKILPLKVI